MSHGFERRESETFVERREDENFGGVIKNSKDVDRNETEKANVVLDSGADDGATKIGVLADLVSNDDELEVGVASVFGEFGLEGGERFDDARDVFVWADASGVEDERRVDLIAFDDRLTLFGSGVSEGESFVERVVDDFDLFFADLEEALEILLGEVRDGEETLGFLHDVAREIEVHDASDTSASFGSVHVIEQIVHGHDVWTRHGQGPPESVRNVNDVAVDVLDDATEFEVDPRGDVAGFKRKVREVGREFAYLTMNLLFVANEEVFVRVVEASDSAHDVAQVGGNAEIAESADIEGYAHERQFTVTGFEREKSVRRYRSFRQILCAKTQPDVSVLLRCVR